METIEYTEPASDLAAAGAALTLTKGPGALESLVEVMLRDDVLAVSDPGGVNLVTCSAIFPGVWGHSQGAGPRVLLLCLLCVNK